MNSNVDIDKIKRSWQTLSDASLKKEVTKSDIEKMMRKKSKSELRKMLVTFLIETLVSVPVLILLWIYMHRMSVNYVWAFDVFMGFTIVLILQPGLKIFKVGKFHDYTTVDYLERFIEIFDYIVNTILKRSKWLLCFAGPLGGLLGFLSSMDQFVWRDMLVIGVVMLLFVPFGLGLYFVLRWYYKHFYGKRVDRLREYCDELQKNYDEEEC